MVTSKEEVKKLLDDGVSAHTRRATETWLAVFTAFCAEQNIQIDLTTCSGEELNQVLCKFYPSLETKKGEMFFEDRNLMTELNNTKQEMLFFRHNIFNLGSSVAVRIQEKHLRTKT